jgi:hypothetical protein
MSRRRKLKINVRTGLPRPELRPWSEYGREAVRACFEAQAWRDGIILIWNDPADWETLDDMRWEYAYGRHQEVHAIGATDRDALEEMVTSLRQARLHLSAAFCETDGLLWVWDNVFHPSMTGHDITADDEQRAAWRKCVATGLEQVGDLIEKLALLIHPNYRNERRM